MTITGLEGNGYLINNPIIVSVSGSDVLRLELNILNQQNGKSVTLPNLYPNPSNQLITFNLDDVIKGLFTEPFHNEEYISTTPITLINNSNKFTITFNLVILGGSVETQTVNKTFIRGGKYNDLRNQKIPSNSFLTPTPITPIFTGYPFSFYYLNSDYKVEKLNQTVGLYPQSPFEYVREKGCNGKYIVFLNHLGGYSYWLFDNFEDEASSSNLGIINNGFDNKDLGNIYDNSFKVFGKIPERFYPLMRDLILSPDIWIWQKETQSWKRIYSDGNKWVANGAKTAYKVDYKFSDFNNYNPALL